MRLFALGFLVGTLALQNMAALLGYPSWHAPLAGAVCIVVAVLLQLTWSRQLAFSIGTLMLAAGVAIGWGAADWRAETRMSDQLPREWEGVDVDLIGVVSGLPQQNERGTRFEFAVEEVRTAGAIIPRRLSLNWYLERTRGEETSKPLPELKPGERWQLTVRLRRPHGTMNPHGFDFEAWALERNIRATGYVRIKGINERRDEFAEGFMHRVDRLRLAIRDRMNEVLKDQPYRGVLVALAIGEQNAIPAEQWRTFWRTGVGHLMSISGLHITMVASLLYWISFRIWARIPPLVLRVPAQRAAALFGAMAALVYSLIAGFSVPTQRTFFMLSTVAIALWLGRATSPSRVLAWALLAVLSLDPWAVLAPGFWLSFGAVAAIFFATAHRTGRMSAWRGAVLTQAAVTLGLLPLTLALFQEVSVVSPLANAFAIPVVSLIVVPLTLLGAVFPVDAFLYLAHGIMSLCGAALAWLAETPNAVWQSHAPPLWTVLLALFGTAWWLLPRGTTLRWPGVVMMLPMFLVRPAGPAPGEVWLTLLDVGQGLATVVRTASHTLVYDTGATWNPDSDSGNRIVVPYLRGEGLQRLDALIVTHDDDDHAGGARSIIAARDPLWVLTSLDPSRDILAGAREVMRCEVGDGWKWDGVEFDILHPTPANYAEEGRKTNNMGCVLKITAPGGRVLMTADIEKKSEFELLARDREDLRADVMVVPHHGSRTSSSEPFLDAVKPSLALLSLGYRNRFRHPNAQVMERYDARHIPVRRTDMEGAITIKFAADGRTKPVISTYRREHLRYWLDAPSFLKDAEKTD